MHFPVQFLFLFLSFVSTCCLSSSLRFSRRTNNLHIDKLSYRNNPKTGREYNLIDDDGLLRKLYNIVETGDLTLSREYLMENLNEIFDHNRIYCYSPAEWAIIQNSNTVLKHFIEESLLKYVDSYNVDLTLKNLLVTSIKSGKFEAFRIVHGKYENSLIKNDFLNLAAQHRVSSQFLDYLLDDCGLAVEIDDSDDELHQNPLHTAIKFNNIDASLKFIRMNSPQCSSIPLQYIMTYNRVRLLTFIFDQFKSEPFLFDCEYRNSDVGNLLHMAAKYTNEPEMMNFILKQCPNLPIDELNKQGETALELSLNISSLEKQNISEILILKGANIFLYSSKGTCLLDRIISNRLTRVFKIVLELFMDNIAKMQEIIEKVFDFRAWSMLDQVLLLLSDRDQDLVIRFEEILLAEIIKEKAHVTFDYVLGSGLIKLDENTTNNIILFGTDDMVKIALKHRNNPL